MKSEAQKGIERKPYSFRFAVAPMLDGTGTLSKHLKSLVD